MVVIEFMQCNDLGDPGTGAGKVSLFYFEELKYGESTRPGRCSYFILEDYTIESFTTSSR